MKTALSKLLVLLLALGLFAAPAFADTVVRNGIEVDLSTDQQQYDEFSVITATLEVTNTTDRDMRNVEMNINIPTGYVLEPDSSNAIEFNRIPAGQSKVLETKLRSQQSAGPEIPDTGDHSHIALWGVAVLVSLTAIILLAAKNPRRGQQMLSLLLCAALLSGSFAGITARADEDDLTQMTVPVSTIVQVNDQQLTINAVVSYEMNVAYNRINWISALLDALGVEPEGTIDHPYSDVAGMPYERTIQTAVALGILIPDGGLFDPTAPATREFAAATAIRSLGYAMEGDIECADASQVTFKQEANLAVDIGMMPLIGDKFCPDYILSNDEAEQVFRKIREVLASENPTDTPTGIKFHENTIVLPSDTEYSINGSDLVFSSDALPENVAVGNVLVIGNNAFGVERIQDQGNSVKIAYNLPSITDFIESVNIRGMAQLDPTRFIPAEGVRVVRTQARDAFNLPGVELAIEEDFDLKNEWELFFNISFDVTKVYYNFDFDVNWLSILPGGKKFVDVKNCYVKFDFTSTIGGGIGRGLLEGGEDDWVTPNEDRLFGEFKLGYIPLIGTDGFGALVEVYAKVTAEGKIELSYNMNGLAGIQILDNHFRNITDIEKGVDLKIAAEVQIGPMIDVVAELFNDQLIDFGIYAGGKAAGEGAWRMDAGMFCIDGSIGTFGTLEALDDSLIGEWLDTTINIELWDYNFLEAHFENLRKVEECTYNKGILRGTVAEADDRTSYIEGAKVVVYHGNDQTHELGNERTDRNGQYEMSLVSGTHTLHVSADGYIPFETLIDVETEHELYVETLLMVEGEEGTDETGVFGGRIIDAITGEGIKNAKLTIRRNWNVTSGSPIREILTDANGYYTSELPLGNYTVLMEHNKYVTNHFNIAVTRNTDMQKNGSMLPKQEDTDTGDVLTVVLHWGAVPEDLDSHMWGPTNSDNYFHTYYNDKTYYENGSVKAFLDLDDIDSYGPETTTVYELNDGGVFSFYVHDFTNRHWDDSTQMSNSGAYVEVFRGTTELGTFHIPTGKAGTVWHVFNYNADTRTLTPVNLFSSEGNASQVGSPLGMMNRGGSDVSPDKK